MKFPIYTKHPEDRYFACLKDKHESVLVVGGIWPRIDATRYRNITSNEYDEYANRVTVQCTREEFMQAYNKAIETITSKI